MAGTPIAISNAVKSLISLENGGDGVRQERWTYLLRNDRAYILRMSKPNRGKKSRSASDILAGKPRCIYCTELADTVEHMPPLSMFRQRDRPSGLEFPSCYQCNNGTRAADTAVAFFARISRLADDPQGWQTQEALKHLRSMGTLAPGFINELFDDGKVQDIYLRTQAGVLVPVTETHAGPISQALLNVFSAKLGMAIYREHIGEPLPEGGGVHAMWFLNNGLSQQVADGMLKILPAYNTLTQARGKAQPANSTIVSIVTTKALSPRFRISTQIFISSQSRPPNPPNLGFPSLCRLARSPSPAN